MGLAHDSVEALLKQLLRLLVILVELNLNLLLRNLEGGRGQKLFLGRLLHLGNLNCHPQGLSLSRRQKPPHLGSILLGELLFQRPLGQRWLIGHHWQQRTASNSHEPQPPPAPTEKCPRHFGHDLQSHARRGRLTGT